MTESRKKIVSVGLLPFVSLIGGVGLILWSYSTLTPWIGTADKPEMGANELATLALQGTQFLQGLVTAVVGGLLLLLGNQTHLAKVKEKLSLFLTGIVFLVLSLVAGLFVSESMVEAALQSLVHAKVEAARGLRVAQAGFALAGVCLAGWSLFWDRLTKENTTEG